MFEEFFTNELADLYEPHCLAYPFYALIINPTLPQRMQPVGIMFASSHLHSAEYTQMGVTASAEALLSKQWVFLITDTRHHRAAMKKRILHIVEAIS